jgi:DnaJ-class molecular chaperone
MASYKATCGRCGGTGRYDRGTCFGCQGAGYKLTARKPSQKFTVSAVYSDGVRRVMRNKAAATAEKAVAAVLAERDWSEFFDLTTVAAD